MKVALRERDLDPVRLKPVPHVEQNPIRSGAVRQTGFAKGGPDPISKTL